MISKKKNFLFIHVPKTGGNSVQNILRNYSEDKVVTLTPLQDGLERFEVRNNDYSITKHSTYSDYKREIEPELFEGLFKFAVVRNPWDRVISHYFSPHRGFVQWSREDFIDFIPEVEPIRTYICPKNSVADLGCFMDFILRFESLEQDLLNISKKLNIDFNSLPHRNKSFKKPYRSYYDDELKNIIYNKFEEEIEFFKYQFSGE